ncbi:ZYRO0C01980p [Zygosaccharomyces rouxii]|uniref:ZYRO0C01980p n=1 Tax=Zygosaccharomyces rouxii (strain ATCC 2623 / CBS 732 / NBRC 1130 / NCYC 568 / NRRL Y-229) TaxID=559307 RepID=C5DSP7_ZYGRC|nr:uncharacterized protein ZYRO0C01980g [Zygosaccharomyces rouxii]KAH9202002.1 Pleckstrin homology domain-containing protein [Zygosaccharomyces rouxii]CAR26808.1 ZYRO0C01980p [Zygosaccharomyces rouxii]
MTLSTEEVINIVIDDEKYTKHVNSHSLPSDAKVRIFEIPKSSFTAFRLSYASPVELSLSSKVVLLGGVPEHWYQAQTDSFKRELLKAKTPKVRGRVDKLTKYGLRAVYNSENFEEEISSDPCSKEGQDIEEPHFPDVSGQTPGKIKHSATSNSDGFRRLKRNTQQSPFIQAVDFYQTPSFSRRGKLKASSKTSGDIPTIASLNKGPLRKVLTQIDECEESSPDHNLPDRSLNEDKGQNDALSEKSSGRLRRPSTSISSGKSDHDSHQDRQLLDQLYREQELNEIEMNKLLNGVPPSLNQDTQSTDTYVSAAAESDDVRESREGDHGSTTSVISSSAGSTLSIADASRPYRPTNSVDNTKHYNLNFNLQDPPSHQKRSIDQTLSTQKHIQDSKEPSVVFMKAMALSKDYKRLSVLKPNPEQISSDQRGKPTESDKNLSPKVHRLKLESFNDKREGMVARVRQGFSRRYGSHSSHLHRDRSGPIVMMDKMLVMVKNAISQRNPIADFSEAEPIDTRVTYRWREYLVVARLTHRNDHPILIQFCHGKHFSHLQRDDERDDGPGNGNTLDFYVSKNCIVGLYNLLDNTIFIEKPDDKLNSHTLEELYGVKDSDLSTLRFYILKCRTLASTSKWYDFLQNVTGMPPISNKISLRVPEANVLFTVHLNKDALERLDQIEVRERKTLKISCLPRGYCVFQIPILRYLSVTVDEKLRAAGYSEVVKRWEGINVNLGCNFRHYDMINWCPGYQGTSLRSLSALFQSHVLEFRPYTYYGRKLNLTDGSTLLEPAAVEGFLLKLTNYKGLDKNVLGKPYLKPAYFFTSENLLFTMGSIKSTPPVPLELLISATDQSDEEKVNTSLKDLPEVYEQNPYPLDLESHIEWLKDKLDEEVFALNDYYAFKCFNRRIIQILKSEGLLDMTDIEEVYQGSITDIQSHEINYQIYNQARSTFWKVEKSLNETAQSLIFIQTKDRRIMKLLAPNQTVCKEWVTRLRALVKYWKEKQESDFRKLWSTKVQNIKNLKIDEVEEANINGRTPKWMTERGVTDPSIYNINALAVLRPILHRGVLHQKPKKHSVFSKYWVVLIPGFLILYRYFRKSKTGYVKSSIDHVHHMTIPIEECYVYSGTLTELDLIDRDKTFDEFNPGSHSLPRIYDDGWTSSETETSRCFTLWFGKKKILSKSSRNLREQSGQNNSPQISDLKNEPASGNLQNPNMIKMVKQLGVSGRSMVFMARSRQERDIWVLSLHYELERLMNYSR